MHKNIFYFVIGFKQTFLHISQCISQYTVSWNDAPVAALTSLSGCDT
jgi:hypothetical protein